MEKISEEISKKILSLKSGNIVGFVLDVLFDEELKTLSGFVVADDESEELLFLDLENVKSIGDDCIVIEDEYDLEIYISSLYNNPIGKIVYDSQGLNLGKVVDVFLQGKNVKKIVTTKCEFPLQYLRKAGEDCLIFGKKAKKNSKNMLFKTNSHNLPKITVQNITNNFNDKINYNLPSVMSKVERPIRLTANSNSLIGRQIVSDLIGYNNELIARKGDIINQKIINKAKYHNKLNLLLMFSK